jgi:VanZ family protein
MPRLLRKTLWTTTIAYWVFLVVITHIPQPRIPRVPMTDKTAHLIAYFVLASLLSLSFWAAHPDRRFTWLWVLAICAAYGAIDEVSQDWVNRYSSWADYWADCIGASVGVALIAIVRAIRDKRGRTPFFGVD